MAASPSVRVWVAALFSGAWLALAADAAMADPVGNAVIAPARASRQGDSRGPDLGPGDSQAAGRGREVEQRFNLTGRFDLMLEVNDAFSARNRQVIASLARALARLPGVRQVTGPADLLALEIDAGGRLRASPLLAGGASDEEAEVVRQRLIRRSDAVGWFIQRDGTELHYLIDTDDSRAIQGAVETAVASSGLGLLGGVAPATPLWPEPARERGPLGVWLSLSLVGLAVLIPALVLAVSWRPGPARTALAAAAAGVAAAAPAMLAPAPRLREVALGAGVCAALLLASVVLLVAAIRRLRRRFHRLLGGHVRRHLLFWRSAPDLKPEAVRPPARVSPPAPAAALVQIVAAALLIAAVALSPRLALGTQLWRPTSVFFVEVRGDLDQPIVLREVRRLTDFLRAEPGVAHAWSIADLFFAVPVAGEVSGIPHSAGLAHAILSRAMGDAAAGLELAPDHRAALIAVRLDDESGVDRLVVIDRLERYLALEHRPALLRVDVSQPSLSPATRALGRGILSSDARERVLRICARAGRNLGPDEVETIERELRRASLVPMVDPPRLKTEIRQEVNANLERVAVADSSVGLPRPAERQRLADDLFAQPADATVADVRASLRSLWGRRVPDAILDLRAAELQGRLRAVRRRHTARINFNGILYGADLPTEGMLSEEVRDATLEAMGPIVGVPVARDTPGAFTVEAVAVGGAPRDRALSIAWLPRMKLGILIGGALTALLLAAVGGLRALAWWPVSLAFAAPLLLVPAIAGVPIGTLYLSVLAGTLAGGAAFAVVLAPGRHNR